MRKQRASANTPALSRRTAMTALAASPFFAAHATIASVPSTLPQLYQKWVALGKTYNCPTTDLDDPTAERVFREITATEDQIRLTPPASIVDYAIKILVADDCGDLNGSNFQISLVNEARAIVEACGCVLDFTYNGESPPFSLA